MWKYKPLTLVFEGEKTTDYETGQESFTGRVESEAEGFIVPAGAEDVARGFQEGSFACYCRLPWKPTIGTCQIMLNKEAYQITKVEHWEDKGLYILELKKWA
jgi:hypothetical protein